MGTLTGQRIKDTYDGLLKTSSNSPISSSEVNITDGFGNVTGIRLSSNSFEIQSGRTFSFGNNVVSGTQAFAMGRDNAVSADYAFALGRENEASAIGAKAIGYRNEASGFQSTAIGMDAVAENFKTLALGSASIATGNSSVAIGNVMESTGYQSLAIGTGGGACYGNNSIVISTTQNATLENYSVGIGADCFSKYSAAIGSDNTSTGIGYPFQNENYLYAFGRRVQLGGNNNVGIGYGILTQSTESNRYVFGQWYDYSNAQDNSIVFALGTSVSNRYNALEIRRPRTVSGNTQSGIFSTSLKNSTSFSNDTAAATGGVEVGELYRTGSTIKIRMT